VLSLTIQDAAVLHATFMPFIRGGALFVPPSDPYRLGDEVFILLRLPDDPVRIPVAGRVVWLTPPDAARRGLPGIGVQLSPEDDLVRSRIKTCLAGADFADQPTHTM